MTVLARIFTPARFTGWHMAAIMIAFFAVIIAVNLTMAWFASNSWSGLIVKNTYVESQNFNAITAERRRADAIGWHGTFAPDGDGVTLTLTDAAGAPVYVSAISARIGRPATAAHDFAVEFFATGDGVYHAATDLAPGIWQAHVAVTRTDGGQWTRIYRFTAASQ